MGDYPRSRSVFERAARSVPAGVSTNTRARSPHPLYFEKAEGAWVWDADGNRHLDIVMGNGAVLLGHGHAAVAAAVRQAVESGLTCGVESTLAVDAAESLKAAAGWPDLVRFTNTGTEAVQHALHIARHATGRRRVAKVEGSYHGWSDEVFVSVWVDPEQAGPPSCITPVAQFAGQRSDLVAETLVLPFNDPETAEARLNEVGGELAAILLEPALVDVGFIPGRKSFLETLRGAADRHGIVLVFDELLTGLNVAVGGIAQLSDVTPDLALFGKAVANGFPLAAVAGREELMRMTEPGKGPAFVGTFNGHAVSVAAASATIPILASGDVQREMAARNKRLKAAFEAEAGRLGMAAQYATGGSHFHWYFCDGEVVDFRSAARTDGACYRSFTGALSDARVLTLPNPLSHHAISLGHGEEALAVLEEAQTLGLRAAAGAD